MGWSYSGGEGCLRRNIIEKNIKGRRTRGKKSKNVEGYKRGEVVPTDERLNVNPSHRQTHEASRFDLLNNIFVYSNNNL